MLRNGQKKYCKIEENNKMLPNGRKIKYCEMDEK